ncbi:stage II sporulation protein M [Halegenticoccus soli]|uniref:stage II sporulation protein M n=1 Tax=Halegenticoccus soli TaxID=1985678 RepID=UPI00117A8194|nr:stage II sporulation protein M [Halegenticoccus soli]
MNVSTALRSGLGIPVRRAGTVLPFYLLATGAIVVARAPILVGAGAAFVLLDSQGRIDPLVSELRRLDRSGFDPESPESVPPGLLEAIGGLVTPSVLGILGTVALASIILLLLARAAAAAATLGAVYAALRGDDPLTEGVAGIARHWRAFVGLGVLRAALFGLAGTPLLFGVLLAPPGPVGIALALLAGLLSALLALLVTLALAFVGQAVVVEGAGVLRAVRRSAGFAVRRPVAFLFYAIVAGAALVLSGTLTAAFNLAGAPQAAAVIATLAVVPIVDGFKTSLYAERGLPERSLPAGELPEGEPPERERDEPPRRRVVGAFRRGWRRLGAFVRSHPAANLAGLACLGLGVAAGWLTTAPYGVQIDPPGEVLNVFGAIPVGPFVNIAANNWLVGASAAYGGVALGVPTATTLLFNGVVVGALAGVFDGVAFLALVAPHGVIELPAIAVAGGLGFHLGRVGWDALRGRRDAASVGEEIGRAFDVLLGLALVFVVAAFVEAFLTPRVAALVLGG